MSSIVGAKAISLVEHDGIRERPHSRVFIADSSNGTDSYIVVIGADGVFGERSVCTCTAGANHRRCYHVAAAKLLIARENRDAA